MLASQTNGVDLGPEIERTELAKLEGLADRINDAHNTAVQATQNAFDRWVEVGKLLKEAKEKVKEVRYGGWSSFVEENLTFTRQQAHKYITAAERKDEVVNSGLQLTSLNQLNAYFAKPRRSPQSPRAIPTAIEAEPKEPGSIEAAIRAALATIEFNPEQLADKCDEPNALREQLRPYERLADALDERLSRPPRLLLPPEAKARLERQDQS